jgi:hypothetical protein
LQKEATQHCQVFFSQGNDDQKCTHLLSFERASRIREREVAERHIGTAKIVLLRQGADDLPVHFASQHSDGYTLQAGDVGDRGSRWRNKQYHGVCQNDDGLRLRQVPDVAAHDGEIGFVRRKHLGRLERAGSFHQLEAYRCIRGGEPACQRRHQFRGLAVQRSDRDGQRRRARIPAIAKQSCPRHQNDDARYKGYPKP